MSSKITATADSERIKRQKTRAALKRLQACRADRDRLLSMYPDHAEARRLFEKEIARLTAEFEALVRA